MSRTVDVFDSGQNVTVTITDVSTGENIAVANADFLPHKQYWWLARVFVKERYRGSGLGTLLLLRLQAVIKKKPVDVVVVSPGGYGSDIDSLIQFYKKSEFRLIREDLMLWSPRDVVTMVDGVVIS